MNNLVEITVDPEIRKDPKKLGEMIVALAEDIESCKDDLTELKERNVFKKLFSNNTRDLADSMLKQQDTISMFLTIVQSLIVLNFSNTAVLAGIHDEIAKHEKGRGDFSNSYLNMAKEYLAQSIESAKRINEELDGHGQAIETLNGSLNKKDALDKEQTELINELIRKNQLKEDLDRKQSKQIEDHANRLTQKEVTDAEQSKAIELLQSEHVRKNKVDDQQSSEIASLRDKVHKLESQIIELSKGVKGTNYLPHFATCAVLAVVSIIISGIALVR